MSHFTVLVTKTQEDDIDSQLEKFNEQGEENDYFMEKEIEFTKAEFLPELRATAKNYLDNHKEAVKKRRLAKRTFKETDGWTQDKDLEKNLEREAGYKNHYKENYDEVMEYINNDNLEEGMLWLNGGIIDEDGNLCHMSNPNAKWDWYSTGGRWTGYLKLKPGAKGETGTPGVWGNKPKENHVDIALAKDIDWDGMKQDNIALAEKRWAEYQEKLANNEKVDSYWHYGISRDDTKESFIKSQAKIETFAILHEGEWYESGSMGWFGISSSNIDPDEWSKAFDKIIASLDPEDEITIVDCHI